MAFSSVNGNEEKIAGVHIESPKQSTHADYLKPLQRIAANWIAIVPFAFMEANEPEISYNDDRNWWGDTPEGIQNTAKLAKSNGLKIVLKPHFWVNGHGWAGQLEMNTKKWELWEKNYEHFILDMATVANSLDLEMLCIGVEMKTAVIYRPSFWKQLIPKIRAKYKGKLIYAANWDNYTAIPFWNQLDYIGIDAYFPLSQETTPTKTELIAKWKTKKQKLANYSKRAKKPIIFTEMGYRSIDKGTWKQWEIENAPNNEHINLTAQQNAYEALFETFWNEPWFKGGFIWEWHPNDNSAGGTKNSNYTPQHKPVEQIIKKWYES